MIARSAPTRPCRATQWAAHIVATRPASHNPTMPLREDKGQNGRPTGERSFGKAGENGPPLLLSPYVHGRAPVMRMIRAMIASPVPFG